MIRPSSVLNTNIILDYPQCIFNPVASLLSHYLIMCVLHCSDVTNPVDSEPALN